MVRVGRFLRINCHAGLPGTLAGLERYMEIESLEEQFSGARQQSGTVPIIEGQRATKGIWTKIFSLLIAKHSYIIVDGLMIQVLGNPGSSHNQQVRINDPGIEKVSTPYT